MRGWLSTPNDVKNLMLKRQILDNARLNESERNGKKDHCFAR